MLKPPKENIIYRTLDFLHEHIIMVIIAVVILVSVVSVLVLALGGGSSSSSSTTTSTSSDTKYKTSSTVYLPLNKLKSLNPLSSNDSDTYYITQLIYSGLFKLDKNLNVEGDLADSYSTSASSGEVTVKLKSAKFSDGSSVTASDVRYTVGKIKEIGSKSPYYKYASKIDSVSTSGSRSVTIRFKSKYNAAVDNLVFPIVSSSDYSKGSSYKPMGSGQYKYSSYNKKTYLKLVPNKDYFGDVAKNNIKFKRIKYSSKTMNFITTDALTAYVSTSSNAKSSAEDKSLKCTQIKSNEMEYLGFNFKDSRLAQRKVRQAIAYAINTDSIVSDYYGDAYILSDSIYFPGFLGTKNNGDPYKYNQSKALGILKKLGYADSNEDGTLEDNKGKDLTLSLIVNTGNRKRLDAANEIAAELTSIGIKTTVNKYSWTSYKSALSKGNYDLVIGGYKFDKEYNLRDLFDKGNDLNYSNSAVVSDVDKMETSLKSDDLKSLYSNVKSELEDDLPYYCLCYKKYSFITGQHFSSSESPTFFDRYRGISTWEWKKAVTPDTASDTYDSN